MTKLWMGKGEWMSVDVRCFYVFGSALNLKLGVGLGLGLTRPKPRPILFRVGYFMDQLATVYVAVLFMSR